MSILYVVGTPIGNLQDMTFRAVKTLSEVDFIAAEDTRVTLKLLNHFDIKKPMVSYYEHNLKERGEYILNRILNGETCAIVSDAGMPCISDPGEDLVRLCRENNVSVQVVPGASAVISALALSGLNVTRFTFEGFLSTTKKNRNAHLETLANETRTMVFYEAPHKLMKTLEDFKNAFGETRTIVIAREITKIYEEVLKVTLAEAIEHFTKVKPKGEFVLVLDGKTIEEENISFEKAVEMARQMLDSGVKSTDAAKAIAKKTEFNKAEIYKAITTISQ